MGKILSMSDSIGPWIASPVDEQVLAGDEAGMFRAEKGAVGPELRGTTVASRRIGLGALAPELVEALAGRGQHPADMRALRAAVEDPRQQVIDGDVAPDGLSRQP